MHNQDGFKYTTADKYIITDKHTKLFSVHPETLEIFNDMYALLAETDSWKDWKHFYMKEERDLFIYSKK